MMRKRRSGYENKSTGVWSDIYTAGYAIDALPLVRSCIYKMMIPLSTGHARANLTRTQIRLVSDIASCWPSFCLANFNRTRKRSTVHGSSRQALRLRHERQAESSVEGPRALLWGRQDSAIASGWGSPEARSPPNSQRRGAPGL